MHGHSRRNRRGKAPTSYCERSNSALLNDAFYSALRAARGAAKRERCAS
jgi:hypothetical protein